MLRKIIGLLTSVSILIFCLCGNVAVYGNSSNDVICYIQSGEMNNCSRRAYMQGDARESDNQEWYLYDEAGPLYTEDGTQTRASVRFNNQTASLLQKNNTGTAYMDIDTTAYENDWFYSKGTANEASLRTVKISSGTYTEVPVITYEVEFTYENDFAETDFLVITSGASSYGTYNKAVSIFSVDDSGVLVPDAAAEDSCKKTLILGNKYKIGVVLSFSPTDAQGVYTYTKSVILDNQPLWTGDGNGGAAINVDLKFGGMLANLKPWTRSEETGYTQEAEGTVYAKKDNGNNYDALSESNNSVYKYTLKGVKFELNSFRAIKGDAYELIRQYNELEIEYADGENAEGVISNVTLPITASNNATVKWVSSKPEVLSNEGVINTDAFEGYKSDVVLTATISNAAGTAEISKIFNLTVKKDTSGFEGIDYVNFDLSMITLQGLLGDRAEIDGVTGSVTLPGYGEGGSVLRWEVLRGSEAAILDDTTLRFIQSRDGDTVIELEVTATYFSAQKSKSFVFFVPQIDAAAHYREIDELANFTKIYDSSGLYPVGSPDPKETPVNNGLLLVNNLVSLSTKDQKGVGPVQKMGIPWLVYKFENPIYGFRADTVYTDRGGMPTDFRFEVSADGIHWTPVSEELISGEIASSHTGGNFDYPFIVESIEMSEFQYYLKVIFGDMSSQNSPERYSIMLDRVTVDFFTKTQQAAKELTFDDFTQEPIDAVTTDLVLPESGIFGTQIEWTSSNSEVLSEDGSVDTDAFTGYSVPVTLTARVMSDEEIVVKKFDVTVRRAVADWNDEDYVKHDLKCLKFSNITSQPQDMLVSNIFLPQGVDEGSSFSWSVERGNGVKEDAVSLDGYVLSFKPDDFAPSPLTLKVTATYGEATGTKEFPVSILRGYAENLLLKATVTATSEGIRKALSRDMSTMWTTTSEDNIRKVNAVFQTPVSFNAALIAEYTSSITNIKIRASNDNSSWVTIYDGASKGSMVREPVSFDSVTAKYVEFIFSASDVISICTIELYDAVVSVEQSLKMSIDEIELPKTVSGNLSLPTTGKYAGSIIWTSSNEKIISTKGVVTPPVNRSTIVTLTATISQEGCSPISRSFTVEVIGKVVAGGLHSEGSSGGDGGGGGGAATAKEFIKSQEKEKVSSGGFADVGKEHWAYKYINKLLHDGAISKDNNFRPDDTIKREEFVKLLVAATGLEMQSEGNNFSDVSDDSWYAPYLLTAAASGLINGQGDGTFGVGTSIRREDAAVILHRLMDKYDVLEQKDEKIIFVDGHSISAYAQQAVKILVASGIFAGDDKNQFRPSSALTRAESAKIICVMKEIMHQEG